MDNKQKQHLLAYLGYYAGEIDGILGSKSTAAAKAFQEAYGLEPSGDVDQETQKALKHAVAYGMPVKMEPENFWDSIKHFDREEFRCKCGGAYCDGFPAEPSEKLIRLADRVREHFGAPMIVSSGVRCDAHNANVGGVPGSRHRIGTAMDFTVRGLPSSLVLAYVQAQPSTHYAYAINDNYIHMDVIE